VSADNPASFFNDMNSESAKTSAPENAGKGKDPGVEIHIDNKSYKAPKNPMTGAELKQLGGIAGGYDLWQKVPSKDDKMIKDNESVQLKNGEHFYSAPSSLNPGAQPCVY
jgi:hypothetical protein